MRHFEGDLAFVEAAKDQVQNLSKPGMMVEAASMGQSPLTVRLLGTEEVSSKPGARAQWIFSWRPQNQTQEHRW